jgi:hypothetical protein
VRVVDLLEAVEVEEHEGGVRMSRVARDALERRVEAAAVAQPGQRVALGERALLRLGADEAALEDLHDARSGDDGGDERQRLRREALLRHARVVEQRRGVHGGEQERERPRVPRREEVGDEQQRADQQRPDLAGGSPRRPERGGDHRHRRGADQRARPDVHRPPAREEQRRHAPGDRDAREADGPGQMLAIAAGQRDTDEGHDPRAGPQERRDVVGQRRFVTQVV